MLLPFITDEHPLDFCAIGEKPDLVQELYPIFDVKNNAREAKHPLQFGAKNKTYRRKNRPSLVLIFNPLSNVRNIERVEEHF